jgi:hypothetical protein
MPTTTAQEVKRVPHSEELLHPGDYAFVAKREPIVITNSEPVPPPTGFFRRLWWTFFGEKAITSKTLIRQWPDIDTVIVNCPLCNGPVATTKHHTIKDLDPLTIETPITCPYCGTFKFKVVQGKIVLA